MCARKTHAAHLNAPLVRRLLTVQFPEWADLPIRSVEFDGWDNTTFRLGTNMSVRLPSHAGYAAQVEKEHEWLPKLASQLPLPIPVPLAKGVPSDDFPLPWSVYRWIDGEVAARGEHAVGEPAAQIDDLTVFATELGAFLAALYRIDPAGGPQPGWHNFFRGGPLTTWSAPSPLGADCQTMDAIAALGDTIDTDAAIDVWRAALDATWGGAPVWVHGDVAPTNLLVRDGRLHAVIDFGCSAVGDPACDLVSAWTFFTGDSREAFRAAVPLDPATWARGRGWALWKAAIALARAETEPVARSAQRVLEEVLADHIANL